MVRTREKLENPTRNPWVLLPSTWEGAPQLATLVRRAILGEYGTTITVDSDVPEWPENLTEVIDFSSSWKAFKYEWKSSIAKGTVPHIDENELVDLFKPKFATVAHRQDPKTKPWVPSLEQLMLMTMHAQQVRRMILGSWEELADEFPHSNQDEDIVSSIERRFVEALDPYTSPEDRFLSPEFIGRLQRQPSPYMILRAVRNRFNARAEDVAPLVAPQITRVLATMDLSPLYCNSESKVWSL